MSKKKATNESIQFCALEQELYEATVSLYGWSNNKTLINNTVSPEEIGEQIRTGWIQQTKRKALGEYIARALCFGENFEKKENSCCLLKSDLPAKPLWAIVLVSHAPQPSQKIEPEIIALKVSGSKIEYLEIENDKYEELQKDLLVTVGRVDQEKHLKGLLAGIEVKYGNVVSDKSTGEDAKLWNKTEALRNSLFPELKTQTTLVLHNQPTALYFLGFSFIVGIAGDSTNAEELAKMILRRQASAVAWIMSSVTRCALKPFVIEHRLSDYIIHKFDKFNNCGQENSDAEKTSNLKYFGETLQSGLQWIKDSFGKDAELELPRFNWITLVQGVEGSASNDIFTVFGESEIWWADHLKRLYLKYPDEHKKLLNWSPEFQNLQICAKGYACEFLILRPDAPHPGSRLFQMYSSSKDLSGEMLDWIVIPLAVDSIKELLLQNTEIQNAYNEVKNYHSSATDRENYDYSKIIAFFEETHKFLTELCGNENQIKEKVFFNQSFYEMWKAKLECRADKTLNFNLMEMIPKLVNYALLGDFVCLDNKKWKAILYSTLQVTDDDLRGIGINIGFQEFPTLQLLHAWDSVHRLLLGDYARQLAQEQATEAALQKAEREKEAALVKAEREQYMRNKWFAERFVDLEADARKLVKFFSEANKSLHSIESALDLSGADFLNLYNKPQIQRLFDRDTELKIKGKEKSESQVILDKLLSKISGSTENLQTTKPEQNTESSGISVGRKFTAVHDAPEMTLDKWDDYKAYLRHYNFNRYDLIKLLITQEINQTDKQQWLFRFMKNLVQDPHDADPHIYASQLAGCCFVIEERAKQKGQPFSNFYLVTPNENKELNLDFILNPQNGWNISREDIQKNKPYGLHNENMATRDILDAFIKLVAYDLNTSFENDVKIEKVEIGLMDDFIEAKVTCNKWFKNHEKLIDDFDDDVKHSLRPILKTLATAHEQKSFHFLPMLDSDNMIERLNFYKNGFYIAQGKIDNLPKTIFQLRFVRGNKSVKEIEGETKK